MLKDKSSSEWDQVFFCLFFFKADSVNTKLCDITVLLYSYYYTISLSQQNKPVH